MSIAVPYCTGVIAWLFLAHGHRRSIQTILQEIISLWDTMYIFQHIIAWYQEYGMYRIAACIEASVVVDSMAVLQ